MKVHELIAILQVLSQDVRVMVEDADTNWAMEVINADETAMVGTFERVVRIIPCEYQDSEGFML